MSIVYNYREFTTEIVPKYFKLKDYDEIEKTVTDFFERRNARFVSSNFYIQKAVLNITQLNIENFLKKDKSKYKFLELFKDNLKVYIFEYVKPYYNLRSNDFNDSEIVNDLYIYDIKQDKIISYIEVRQGISGFQVYSQEGFIGYIQTEMEYEHLNFATFMLRVSATYLWIRRRKKLYSDTCLSDKMIGCCRNLAKKKKWVIREDYYNNYHNKEQERYLFNPIKLNVYVEDSNFEFEF